MARRGNFGAEKRQKELRKKKKREEKLARKHLKKQDGAQETPAEEQADKPDDGVQPSRDAK